MRVFLFIIFAGLACVAQDIRLNNTPVAVYFSPNGNATNAIVQEIKQARSEILIQAFSFTSTQIAKALTDASARRVTVIALFDKSDVRDKFGLIDALAKRGIQVMIDDKHAIAHNKIMIIDRATLITGSFNFTKAAEEHNAENLLIIKNGELSTVYLRNFVAHREHSVPYQGK
jgi:phosphatidylserine/phosphatidylglycerophosphate/cardiolipin synthase-like enzyme